MLKNFFKKHKKTTLRFLEILPGFVSWNLILFPFWGSFFFPLWVAYYILFFDIYWLYRSTIFGATSVMGHYKIKASKKTDWLAEAKTFGDWHKVHHVVLVVTYKEPLRILRRTFKSLADQDLPKEQLTVVLGMEANEDKASRDQKVAVLRKEFGDQFAHLLVTVHELKPGEVAGKSSNENHAAREAKKILVDEKGFNIDYMTVTSCDADHVYHSKYFSALTYEFLDEPQRYLRFWQPTVLPYNNIWRLPALTRIMNIFTSLWSISQSVYSYKLVNWSNYSLSMRLAHEIDYWDPDVIPEDYRMFFKAFFAKKTKVEVNPIALPVWADAAEAKTTFKSLKSYYEQQKRWAWGTSDDPYFIYNFLTSEGEFFNKLFRVFHILKDHFLWPVNWFIISLGINIPVLINPRFTKTAMGYKMTRFSGIILSLTVVGLIIALWVNSKHMPQKPSSISRLRALLLPLEFILMPVAGFLFSALPGIDAHTRLMVGKYLEYRVTEKV